METIDAGIPFIGFPIFGDQFQNLKISQENGFGIISNIHTLSEETFERDVKLILTDTRQVYYVHCSYYTNVNNKLVCDISIEYNNTSYVV